MVKDKYKNVNLQSVLDDIGKDWSNTEDLKINEATRAYKIGIHNHGKKVSLETIAKTKATRTANNSYKMSEEQKKYISKIQKGRKQSQESILKRIAANTGKKSSAESIAKTKATRMANGGYIITQESIAKRNETRMAKKLTIPIIYKGVTYPNIIEASKSLNLTEIQISDHLRHIKRKNQIKDKP